MGTVKHDHGKTQAQADEPNKTEGELLQPSTRDNYTICAPQLLHLDTDGKPLWFNGWLVRNKFVDKSSRKFANFQSYLIEPRDIREPGAWQLASDNICCLTSDADKKFDFDEVETTLLQRAIGRARAVGKDTP